MQLLQNRNSAYPTFGLTCLYCSPNIRSRAGERNRSSRLKTKRRMMGMRMNMRHPFRTLTLVLCSIITLALWDVVSVPTLASTGSATRPSILGPAVNNPTLNLTPSSGTVGTLVSVSGSGYNSNASCHIKWDGSQIATASTDASGNLSGSFTVPSGASAGAHTVMIA